MDYALQVKNLTKSYRTGFWLKHVNALNNVSFNVRVGVITGFIGSNGAGKTTTIRCAMNFTHFSSGEILVLGSHALSREVRRHVGYLPEQPSFNDQLTGVEFLKMHADLAGVSIDREQILKELERVRLDHAADRKIRGYSKGMQQRVGLAQALIHRPKFLILDEPMSGLDPDGRRLVKSLLKEVAQTGVSIFFSTHLLDDVEDLCEDVVIMVKGQIRFSGLLKDLLGSESARLEDVFAELNQGGRA